MKDPMETQEAFDVWLKSVEQAEGLLESLREGDDSVE